MDNGWYVPSNTTGWGTSTSTGIMVSSGTFTYPTTPVAPAKKKTPLEWLDDEIERICAMTRPGLVSA